MVQVLSHEFVLAEPAEPAQQVLRAALAPRYSVVADGRARTLRRTWLDTFDWRLARAGLALEHLTGSGPAELVLTCGDGEKVRAAADGLRWPALVDHIPDGPLRDRLSPVTGVRALLPAAGSRGTVSKLRARNPDEKTVAWLSLEAATPPSRTLAALPTRITVTPVRGYQAQAAKISACLAAAPGLAPAMEAAFGTALAAAGRRVGDYTGRVDVELDTGMPACLAIAAVLRHLLATLEANVAGTLHDIDTEFLHDLRVATRRTRTALKLGAPVLPDALTHRYRVEFKWLGDVTTPTRDLDVYLLNYPAMVAALAAATPADLTPFHEHLLRRRTAERRRLVRALRSARFTGLTTTWHSALDGLRARPAKPDAATMASGTIRRAHRRVLTEGRAITPASPPESLHDLRKRCKELRYALEFFATLCDPSGHRQAVRELKGLQECLGTYQDCDVQQQELRGMAAQMAGSPQVPVNALLALGELAGQTARQGEEARGEFAQRFASFAGTDGQAAFRGLVMGVPA